MSKRVLLYTDDYGIGGVAHYNHSILIGLYRNKYEVVCVQSKDDNPLIQQQIALGIEHYWLSFNSSSFEGFKINLNNQAYPEEIFSKTLPDLVFFSNSTPLSNFAAKKVAIKLQIPFLIVEHLVTLELAKNFSLPPYIFYLNELETHYNYAKAVIAVSINNLSLLHNLFNLPKTKGEVIYCGRPDVYFSSPNPLIRQKLRNQHSIPMNSIVCFTAAHLIKSKGYQYQLAAIKELITKPIWDNLYFVWAGKGPLDKKIQDELESLNLSNKVKLLGMIWNVLDWLDSVDIFVLPSEGEGMPLSIMEAMAKGLPVIASAVSGIPEELGETGKLISDPTKREKDSIKEIVETIELWCLNQQLRRLTGLACHNRAKQMFSEKRMVNQIENAIERVLSG